ncbi:ATP-binding protein [Fodinisporobacter ferrooxydans]|uniref:ATP-binding protein n=1 Tax=Fodinisporobacter ferrooxydans TaxID=2901836 RepID=A0ABY4CTI7_9BACL|nr:ATP-binding protein [Alicyclobacillaceae bacterium MYW30-H2]
MQHAHTHVYGTFPSRLGTEKLALVMAERFLAPFHIDEEIVSDIKTILAECCLNAMEHGNAFDPLCDYAVELELEMKELLIRVFNSGTSNIDKDEVINAFPTIESAFSENSRTRGWGLQLIDQLANNWEFCTRQGRTFLEVQVKIPNRNGGERLAGQ